MAFTVATTSPLEVSCTVERSYERTRYNKWPVEGAKTLPSGVHDADVKLVLVVILSLDTGYFGYSI